MPSRHKSRKNVKKSHKKTVRKSHKTKEIFGVFRKHILRSKIGKSLGGGWIADVLDKLENITRKYPKTVVTTAAAVAMALYKYNHTDSLDSDIVPTIISPQSSQSQPSQPSQPSQQGSSLNTSIFDTTKAKDVAKIGLETVKSSFNTAKDIATIGTLYGAEIGRRSLEKAKNIVSPLGSYESKIGKTTLDSLKSLSDKGLKKLDYLKKYFSSVPSSFSGVPSSFSGVPSSFSGVPNNDKKSTVNKDLSKHYAALNIATLLSTAGTTSFGTNKKSAPVDPSAAPVDPSAAPVDPSAAPIDPSAGHVDDKCNSILPSYRQSINNYINNLILQIGELNGKIENNQPVQIKPIIDKIAQILGKCDQQIVKFDDQIKHCSEYDTIKPILDKIKEFKGYSEILNKSLTDGTPIAKIDLPDL